MVVFGLHDDHQFRFHRTHLWGFNPVPQCRSMVEPTGMIGQGQRRIPPASPLWILVLVVRGNSGSQTVTPEYGTSETHTPRFDRTETIYLACPVLTVPVRIPVGWSGSRG